ncbi:uncharacterized protein LOC108742464 [Agrilus planipennis]|uniref:Uncharacterized protein LOC108742464 n=1 Tax=Agrilus planipennis TaxID=224129 RepID=A0A1W4XAX8_AGRPL|nr:uncharacterized protein LOC108742464 [Agrilus planipennis]
MLQLNYFVLLGTFFGNIWAFNDICCESYNSFKICWKISGLLDWKLGPEVICPTDYYCDESKPSDPCILENLTTTPMPTTTSCPTGEIGTEPTCTSEDVYPGPFCNEYYQCSKFLIFWYEVKLKTCESGYAFSPSQKSCILPPGVCQCVD